MQDAYHQAERLMLVMKAASSDSDEQVTVTSGTLAKLSPPTKRTGHCLLFVFYYILLLKLRL